MKFKYYALNKPFQVLSQFTSEGEHKTLADLNLGLDKDIYSVGRLDFDSEGLLLLTNNNVLKTKLLDPSSNTPKTYFVQVERAIDAESIKKLQSGVEIKIKGKVFKTKSAQVEAVKDPVFWERVPPIRERKEIPTSWIKITIKEGKNRQIRRMTAAVGFPTLRLIRTEFGGIKIGDLAPGQIKELDQKQIEKLF